MVKGWIGPDQLVEDCYDGYCRRLWYDEEVYYKDDGFEEAYEKKFKKKIKKSEKKCVQSSESMI